MHNIDYHSILILSCYYPQIDLKLYTYLLELSSDTGYERLLKIIDFLHTLIQLSNEKEDKVY